MYSLSGLTRRIRRFVVAVYFYFFPLIIIFFFLKKIAVFVYRQLHSWKSNEINDTRDNIRGSQRDHMFVYVCDRDYYVRGDRGDMHAVF